MSGRIIRLTELRRELLMAADLACRDDRELLKRIENIREGDGLADLVSDAGAGALLLTDARAKFEAIGFNVDTVAAELADSGAALEGVLAKEIASKTLVEHKATRDRAFTLAANALAELRLFATYARWS